VQDGEQYATRPHPPHLVFLLLHPTGVGCFLSVVVEGGGAPLSTEASLSLLFSMSSSFDDKETMTFSAP